MRGGADADERLLVVLNFSDGEPSFSLPGAAAFDAADLLASNYPVGDEDPRAVDLRPYEARVYRLSRATARSPDGRNRASPSLQAEIESRSHESIPKR